MKRSAQPSVAADRDQEPIGIVISRGPSTEQAPRFAAYVWSADPEPATVTGTAQAA